MKPFSQSPSSAPHASKLRDGAVFGLTAGVSAVIAFILAYSFSDTAQKTIDRHLLEPILQNFVPIYHEGDESTVPYLPSLF